MGDCTRRFFTALRTSHFTLHASHFTVWLLGCFLLMPHASILKPASCCMVFSPEGDTSLPVCVSYRILAPTQPFYILPMRKHLYQVLRNSISVLFSKYMLGL